MDFKQKTISSLFWNFADSMANQGVNFIVGIFLARILSPREFGLIGMLTIFIAVSQAFIDSGFSNALIRKKDCSTCDYSTIFYFNILIGFFLFLLLFSLSNVISLFFNEPELKMLIRVLALSLILNSIAIIQRAILTKELNFKLQAKISFISSISSGIIAIMLAYFGFGVWSLVVLTLFKFGISSIFLWLWTKWRPSWVFSIRSFNELFSFGSKLLISGLIDTIYNNIYYFVIGKYFSAKELGYYTRADQFNNLPSSNLSSMIQRVSFPIFSNIQSDPVLFKKTLQKFVKNTMFITFTLMIGLAAVAEPLTICLIGEKWLPLVPYLQLLCFSGMFYPLHSLNLNVLNVKGRSDLFLKLEIIKKLIVIPVIILGVIVGLKGLIIGMIVLSFIAYYLNSFWSGEFANYSLSDQVFDIFPYFLLAIFMGIVITLIGKILVLSPFFLLIVQITSGACVILGFSIYFKLESYRDIKEILISTFSKHGKN